MKTREMLKDLEVLRFFSTGKIKSANYGLFDLATSQGGAWKEFATVGKISVPGMERICFKTVQMLEAYGGGNGQNI